MTVSRVVRGVQAVAPATAVRVNAAIQKLGYRPDPALSALALRRVGKSVSWTLAFLDCDGTIYTKAMAKAAEEEAAALGYHMERHRLPESVPALKRLREILFHRGIIGLLLGPAETTLDLRGWEWENFAAVSLGMPAHTPTFHAVGMDYHEGMMTALAALAEEGELRPGLSLRSDLNERTGRRWLGAYLAVNPGPPPLIFNDANDLAARIGDWAKRERLSTVLTVDAIHAPVFQKARLRVAYLNQHRIPTNAPHIALDAEPIGVEGVRMLHHLLGRREFGIPILPKVVSLRGRWVRG